MNLLMELASVSKKLNQHQPGFPGNEVEPASWLSNLLARAKIYWMLHPEMHPYGKPDAETWQWRRPNWKEDGLPRRASQHIPKFFELSSRWKKANSRIIQAAGGMNIKWDHSQRLAGWWGWWGYVRIVDMVRTVRMVRMVRMFSKSSESGGPRS